MLCLPTEPAALALTEIRVLVTPVDPSQTLARLAALMSEATGRRRAGSRVARSPRRRDEAKAGGSDHNLAALLAQRIRGVGADHPRRRWAVSRILVESLLTGEFGQAALNDPEFQAIVDDVLATMQRAPGVQADLDRVVDTLLSANL